MNQLPNFSLYGYQAIKQLGINGSGGRVTYQALNQKTGEPHLVVIKQFCFVKPDSQWSGYKAIEKELQTLQRLNHPGIPKYIDVFSTDDGTCLVQEYKDAYPLHRYRISDPDEIQSIAISVLEILVYLQQQNPPIFHRDLKPENILVDDKLNVYLVDFGAAKIGDSDLAASTAVEGTKGFMPPEQIVGKELSKASDLYALGATLISLITNTKSSQMSELLDGNYQIKFKKKVKERYSDRFLNWLEKMVQPEPKKRFPNAKAALKALKPIPMSARSPLATAAVFLLMLFLGGGGSIVALNFVFKIDVISLIGEIADGGDGGKRAIEPPSPSPTPKTTPTVAASPTLEPVASPSPEPIPEPIASPIPEPIPSPSPEAIPEPIPEPEPTLIPQLSSLPVETVGERESNDSWTNAQEIPPIGAIPNTLTVMKAEINSTGDQDWFSVDVSAGDTFAVEVFDADKRLGTSSGSACGGSSYRGLGLIVLDPSATEIVKECRTNGAGNVHHRIQFKAGVDGTYYIGVVPNNQSLVGNYSIRLLPKHDRDGAAWNPETQEPNNLAVNAYLLEPGRPLASSVEERNISYSTDGGDRDWYSFDTMAGETYVIELFDADKRLSTGSGSACRGSSYRGLGLRVLDPLFTEIAVECRPDGAGNMHHRLQFKAGLDGTHYVEVVPNSDDLAGNYKIRLLPKHFDRDRDPNTHEPNNVAVNAYPIAIGRDYAIASTIEERNISYSTNGSDRDWYRFEGVAGETYVAELFNVEPSLEASKGSACRGSTYYGLGLTAYDPSITHIATECRPQENNLHNRLEFKVGLDGTYYIGVLPNSQDAAGSYSIRVVSK
jgi:serine/threonine protein kinase